MVLAGMVLTACTARGPAPVSERGARPPSSVAVKPVTPLIEPSANGLHTVQRGDTLYAIAFANSLDYREIASWNRLESPDRILVGQVLRLSPPPGAVEIQPLEKPPEPSPRPLVDPPVLSAPQAVLLAYSDAGWAQVSGASALAAVAPAAKPEPVVPRPAITPTAPAATSGATSATAVDRWLWPAEGELIGRFGAAGGKGIDLVGARNAPVKAVAPGKVVYSGTGLRGYGHLLIVKHAGEFLSAYAHNDSVLVKEGDAVKAGQRIASMGDSGADRVKLHFEIRRYGKPLDPLDYLPERS
ncbi:MAG: lipoprotein NlpD [Pseudomonadota bacterium]|nr:lipoprotein NlpD [Pseudomonadota bacterium]